jgi:hypothetical protein
MRAQAMPSELIRLRWDNGSDHMGRTARPRGRSDPNHLPDSKPTDGLLTRATAPSERVGP